MLPEPNRPSANALQLPALLKQHVDTVQCSLCLFSFMGWNLIIQITGHYTNGLYYLLLDLKIKQTEWTQAWGESLSVKKQKHQMTFVIQKCFDTDGPRQKITVDHSVPG